MKFQDAQKIIAGDDNAGFRVSFEERDGSVLKSGHFPERGETPFQSAEWAWKMAELFAQKAPIEFVNIYVIHADDFTPVRDYAERKMRAY